MRKWLLICLLCFLPAAAAGSAQAAVFEVGPGRPLTALAGVPWSDLKAGDIVRIYGRSEPYRERVLLSTSGTEQAPIRIEGVPGPDGQLPVIDGAEAVTLPGPGAMNGGRSVLQIGAGDLEPGKVPSYLQIRNLEIRGGRPPNRYLRTDGRWQAYPVNAAALYVARGQHLLIRNCRFLESGNGLFVASSDLSVSKDVHIEECELRGNGNPGSMYEHNSYTAAMGIVFQGCVYGPLHPGALGNNLKDRSSGLIVTGCWIEGGNRQLDLVNAEDSALIRQDPAYRDTYIYNNVLIEPPDDGNRQIVHYGGDTGSPLSYRKGVLHFWQNTVVSYRPDKTALFRLSTDEEAVDLRNNVFHTTVRGSRLALLEESGKVANIGRNWINRGWVERFAGSGDVIGRGGLMEGNDPGFMPGAPPVYALTADSSCAGLTEALPAALLERFGSVEFHPSIRSRVGSRTGDLGAGQIR